MSLEKFNLLNDIYYSKEYVSLYLKENEEIFEFEYKEDNLIFYNIAIKRPITKIGNEVVSDEYFDLETAYGYGGFYLNTENQEFIKIALKKYEQKCLEEKIIAEFIRFHPWNTFPYKYKEFLDMNIYDRDVVYVNLQADYEEIKKQYSSSLKRNIKKAKNLELKYKIQNINSKSIEKFINLYNMTMQKNTALDFYYFKKEYFENLFKLQAIELHSVVYNDEIINMIIILKSNDILYYHLGATNPDYYSLNPNPFIFDCIIQNNYKRAEYLYFGGGTTGEKDDPLLKFKQKFSALTKPFYISGKIYNEELYNKYNTLWKKQSSEDIRYFLKYRLEIQ